jgi:hypothetical protein
MARRMRLLINGVATHAGSPEQTVDGVAIRSSRIRLPIAARAKPHSRTGCLVVRLPQRLTALLSIFTSFSKSRIRFLAARNSVCSVRAGS